MREFNRREFLAIAIPTLAAVAVSRDVFAQSPVRYGLATDTIQARRAAGSDQRPFATYQIGTLLRYRQTENPDWLAIVGDSWHKIPGRAQAHGRIFIENAGLDGLTVEEVSPIATNVASDQKVIEINLTKPQKLIAWEGSVNVHEAPVSAGLRRGWTPTGEFHIGRKRWARYMQGYDFDLPGVPFTQYFHLGKGIAIHGAYWHNDFGNPRSHGCVNVPNNDAQWLFRWAAPTMTDFQTAEMKETGTKVVVHY